MNGFRSPGYDKPPAAEGVPWLAAGWRAPAGVAAMMTLAARPAACAGDPWAGFNLGGHVGDDPVRVAAHWRSLEAAVGRPIARLDQVHGVDVCSIVDPLCSAESPGARVGVVGRADAVVTTRADLAIAIQTADCLPVLFADEGGLAIGAAHAGWRGLAAGVLENTVRSLHDLLPVGASLTAWIGAGIGPRHYEVGAEVREAFVSYEPDDRACFLPSARTGAWMADLPALARNRLRRAGVSRVESSGLCTYSDPLRFYSHRREAPTGRQATLIWRGAPIASGS